MKAGIVCEYNPFHKGHLYQIQSARQMGADEIICVMSGNFVQRGDCAYFDKFTRAKAAVMCGANVVIDLPTPWAMASAETFARGSIGLLEAFGVDALSFGCENDDPVVFREIADIMKKEEFISSVKKYSAGGMSYPLCVSSSVEDILGEEKAKLLSMPNNTLAIEYIRHLSEDKELLAVKRKGANHDSDTPCEGYAPAGYIRSRGLDDSTFGYIPENLRQLYEGSQIYSLKNCERAILSALRKTDKQDFQLYISDNSGLDMRIYDALQKADSLQGLYALAKSKNYTHSRIRREVLSVYLKIPKTYSYGIPPYIKILAADEKGLGLLSQVKKNSGLPIITKFSETKALGEKAKEIYLAECSNTDLFYLCGEKIRECGIEKTHSLDIIR